MQKGTSIIRLPASFLLQRLGDPTVPVGTGPLIHELFFDLLRAQDARTALGRLFDHFAQLASWAYMVRDGDTLGRTSRFLSSLPLPEPYRLIADCFSGLHLQAFENGDLEQTVRLVTPAAERAPAYYRARAVSVLAANQRLRGEPKIAAELYNEAGRIISASGIFDPFVTLGVERMRAVIVAEAGDHREALKLLEKLYPHAHSLRMVSTQSYYHLLNSLAVELCEVGRLEEARNVSAIAMSWPIASAYTQFRETKEEIESRRARAARNIVAVHRPTAAAKSSNSASSAAQKPASTLKPGTLRFRPSPTHHVAGVNARTVTAHRPSLGQKKKARVLDMLEWKRLKERSNGNAGRSRQAGLEARDVLIRIMELAAARERTGDELLKILQAIEGVLSIAGGQGKS